MAFSLLSLPLSRGQNSLGRLVAPLLTFLHLHLNPSPGFPCHSLCITDVTNSECVRNYRTLSPNFIVALVSPDLLYKFSFPFVHIKSISILYSSILVSLPELPSFLPLIGLIRSCCFVLIPSLIGKVLRDLDGAPLMFLW